MRKYQLPTTHPCFTAASEGEWLEEMYGDLYSDQEQALYALKKLDESGLPPKAQEAERRRLHDELQRLSEALGEAMPVRLADTVLDDIETRMARGETDIDLNALLPKGWTPPRSVRR